jgi:hypothetical protein
MAQTPCVQWGTITLVLDKKHFGKGCLPPVSGISRTCMGKMDARQKHHSTPCI